MGWNGKCQLPEDQGSDCQECHQATPLLWPKETSHSTGGCLPKRTWCMLTTGWPANRIRQQELHRHWDQVHKHRKRAPCHCIRLSTVQHLCTGKAIYSGVQSQATGNDTPEEPCQCPPRLQRMLLQLQQYDVTIRYRPGKEMLLTDALSRCPSWASGEIKLDMRVDYIAFSKTWIAKLKDTTKEDPILGTVYQLTQQGWPHQRRHTPRMARAYWDFRDQLFTDEGLLLMGPRIVIPSCLREEYLQRLHQGHLSATKVQQNARQHLYWPGLDADIADYTRRCQECIRRSQPPKEPLQAHEVPQEPWERIAMDYFYMNGRLYILICDYFSKFPFLFQVKTTSFANLKDHLEELFSVEGIPNEIMSDNGPPFNGKEFSSYLTGLGIRHTTSSPNYPRSNGFIERQIQTMKRLIEKANSSGRSHQEALTGLRAQPLGDGLQSPSEILHRRSLVTRKASPVDLTAVRQSLIALQAKYTKSHDKAKWTKTQRALVIGEEVYFLSGKNEWQIGIVTGTTDTGRSYNILTDEGTSLRRNRSHLKPRCHDIPIISCTLPSRTSTPSQSEITRKPLPGPKHPPKAKYFYNNEQNISFQDQYEQHPPKVKYFPNNSVPKLVIRRVGDTAYDSYIAETLYPLKSAIKPRKQTQSPVSRPYQQGGPGHTLQNGPSKLKTQTCWSQ